MAKSKIYDVTATGSTTPRDIRDRFADVVNVKDFGAVGDGVTDDTAAIEKIDRPVYMNGVTVLVDALPNVQVRDNGYWKVKNFYNGLTCLVPASAGTLPHKKTVLNYAPNSTSWAQDSAWHWNGRKGVGYTIGAHGSGGLSIARPWTDASWRSVHQYGSKSHWEHPVLFFGPERSTGPNGYWHEGGGVIDGVEFAIVRRQAAGSLFPQTHQMFRRNLCQWHEGTNIIQSRAGEKTVRIYKGTVNVGAYESLNSKVVVTCSSEIGGQMLTQSIGYVRANNNLFVEVEFSGLSDNFTVTQYGGGYTYINVLESSWEELMFGGKSIGEKLIELADLSSQPVEILGFCPIPNDLTGSAYTSWGSPVGFLRLSNLLQNSTTEAQISVVNILPEGIRTLGYGEPSVAVSKKDSNIVVSMLRTNGVVPPAMCVYTEGITEASVPAFSQMNTATGQYATGSFNPVKIVEGVDGVEHVFSFVADRAVTESETKAGFARCHAYLLHATLDSVLEKGIEAFDWYYLADLDFFDMFINTGEASRSQLGIGSMIDLEDGTLEVFAGEFYPHSTPDQVRANLCSYLIDVSQLTGHIVDALSPISVEPNTKLCIEYHGISVDIPAGDFFKPYFPAYDNSPGAYEVRSIDGVDGSPDGMFCAPRAGFYKVTISAVMEAFVGRSYIGLWDVRKNDWYVPSNKQICALPTGEYGTNDPYQLVLEEDREKGCFYDSAIVYLYANQVIALKVVGTSIVQTVRNNMIRWEEI